MKNMSILRGYQPKYVTLLFALIIILDSCVSSKKIDNYVSQQYNQEVPKQKKLKPELTVKSTVPVRGEEISTTDKRKVKVLPLLVYWKFDQNQTTRLNPAIGINQFTNSVNTHIAKGLSEKLEGRQLELTVERLPSSFAMIAKDYLVFAVIYYVQWSKIYIEPDFTDLVVSYKVTGADHDAKTGKITVKNDIRNKKIRFFQGWKSALRETVDEYNENIALLSKQFVNQLAQEL